METMHELELITRSGPIILMAKTRKQLYAAFRRFVSPDSLALVDEPDETDIPPISEAKKLSLTEISTAEDNREVL